ncbi:hypothetical protein [Absidia glauca]|uniref:Protein kinase domain-containing protein n=1 Tax=Absidia glauca TaxID=4829 RepID=A0A168N3H3_ABSGL|nr:hypothetical protein [Absidia glauca]
MYQIFSATKPDNIFVHADRVRPRHVVIGDFGIAINTNTESSWTDHHGTKAYFAPEMLNDNKITNKVDCWSLGLIMYQLLTRQFPFGNITNSNDDLSWPDIRRWILEGSVEFKTSPVPCQEAISLVEKLLAKDPSTRYSAAQAFVDRYLNELDLSKGSFFEQYIPMIQSHFDRISSATIASSDFAPSSFSRHHHYLCPKNIKLSKKICPPGGKRQRAGFDQGVARAPQPRCFENGQRIV